MVSAPAVVVCMTGSVADCSSASCISVAIVALLGMDVVPSVVTILVVASS